jgi:hypothetical protein
MSTYLREESKMKRFGVLVGILVLFFCVQLVQAGWGPVKRLTFTTGGSGNPAVVVDSTGRVNVFWEEYITSKAAIFGKTSQDGGASWSTAKRLSWTSGNNARPAAAAVDSYGSIHLVWQDETAGNWEIYYRNSSDRGASWSTSKRLTWTSGGSQDASVAADSSGNKIYVSWEDDSSGDYEIYFKKSTDGGASWSGNKRLTWSSGDSSGPIIVVDASDKIHLVWQDSAPGNSEIYYKRSTDAGTSWTASKRLTFTSKDSISPDIAVHSSSVYVTWYDFTYGISEICFEGSSDGGYTWTTTKRLTTTANISYDPTLVVDPSGTIWIVWEYYTPGYDDLYYKTSADGGATWTPSQRLTWTSGDSWFPDMAADSSGNLHLVWEDNSPGNYEIFYKKYTK